MRKLGLLGGLFLLWPLSASAIPLAARFQWADGSAIRGELVLSVVTSAGALEEKARVPLACNVDGTNCGWARTDYGIDPYALYRVDLYDMAGVWIAGGFLDAAQFPVSLLTRAEMRFTLYKTNRLVRSADVRFWFSMPGGFSKP